jgi:hypothetical protein
VLEHVVEPLDVAAKLLQGGTDLRQPFDGHEKARHQALEGDERADRQVAIHDA